MPEIQIKVKGIERLERALGGDFIDDLLRPGLGKAAVIVEGAWKGKAHRVTGKYQGSIGHRLEGHGSGLQARVGPQPGLGQPRHYTASMSSRWKRPRAGTNRGDPQVYAVFEDQGTRYREGHPAAEPAVRDNADRIASVVQAEADRALDRRSR